MNAGNSPLIYLRDVPLNMIVSAYQPYFAPHAGFFAKALLSDVLVLMDAVQFPQGRTWLTRNRFKNDQGILRLSIPVWKRGLGRRNINEVKICYEGRWLKKNRESLITAYGKAPYFEDHAYFFEALFNERPERLVDLNLKIIRHINGFLGTGTKLILLSDLGVDADEPELSVQVSKKLGATAFLAQQSARRYLDEEAFGKAGVNLQFFNPRPPVYPQLWGPFIPNLSILDMLFNVGPGAFRVIRRI